MVSLLACLSRFKIASHSRFLFDEIIDPPTPRASIIADNKRLPRSNFDALHTVIADRWCCFDESRRWRLSRETGSPRTFYTDFIYGEVLTIFFFFQVLAVDLLNPSAAAEAKNPIKEYMTAVLTGTDPKTAAAKASEVITSTLNSAS